MSIAEGSGIGKYRTATGIRDAVYQLLSEYVEFVGPLSTYSDKTIIKDLKDQFGLEAKPNTVTAYKSTYRAQHNPERQNRLGNAVATSLPQAAIDSKKKFSKFSRVERGLRELVETLTAKYDISSTEFENIALMIIEDWKAQK
jgi:hypothetical protein